MDEVSRYNKAHVPAGSPTGGQFGTAGGSKAHPGKGHGAHPTHTVPGGPTHTLAYNAKTNTGPGYNLKNGDPNVKQLQTALNSLGLTDGKGHQLAVDGKLGPLTTQAVKAAQTRLGLKATGHVSPALFARLIALKTLPHRSAYLGEGGSMDDVRRAEMTSASINDLPDSAFAYIEPGGSKDSSGRTTPRELRHFPVHDKAHVQNALSRAPQSPFGEKAMPKIHAAAKKFGVDVADDSSGRADLAPLPFVRSFPLEDISIRTGAGEDGRTVDAYAAVFDVPVPIHDQDGDYIEVIDGSAFNRILGQVTPRSVGGSWRVGVFYNHGMTIHGTPSDMHSMPIGIPLEIKADSRGLFTRTKYLKGETADLVLDRIKEGSLSGYSFSGAFRRSNPLRPRGGFHADGRGNLPTVRRTESTLREYGPTPFPAYQEAEIVGVRAEQITEQLNRITELLRSGAPMDLPQQLSGAPEWDLPPEDLPDGRSGRSVKEELQAARSAFLQKYGSEHDRRNHPRRG